MQTRALGNGTVVSAIGLGASRVGCQGSPRGGRRGAGHPRRARRRYDLDRDVERLLPRGPRLRPRRAARRPGNQGVERRGPRRPRRHKGGYLRTGGKWRHDARPSQLKAACEASLGALGVESNLPLPAPHARPEGAARRERGGARRPEARGQGAERGPLQRGRGSRSGRRRRSYPSRACRTAATWRGAPASRTASSISAAGSASRSSRTAPWAAPTTTSA